MVSGLDEVDIVATTGSDPVGGMGGAGGMIGGSGGTGMCPFDDFGDDMIDPLLWMIESAPNASFSETSGQLHLTVPAGFTDGRYTRLVSTSTHDVDRCTMSLEVSESTLGDEDGEEVYFSAILDAANSVGFILRDGYLSAGKTEGGDVQVSSVTYDPAQHRWWRFHADASDLTFERSPDGATWESFGTSSTGFSLSTLIVAIAGGAGAGNTASGGTAVFDNFNVQ